MYQCTSCQEKFKKWAGQCPKCDTWGTLDLYEGPSVSTGKTKKGNPALHKKELLNLSEIEEISLKRTETGFTELDKILGSGLLDGSLILLGGEPGIGKSTLALQIANEIAKKNKREILYVSGEETPTQLKSRADRLNIETSAFKIYPNPLVEDIIEMTLKEKPLLTIIDSIQTIYSSEIPSETGSATQIRAATHKILEYHKANNLTTLIIGQVTKDGSLAGPKMLEHLVDVVFYIEGDKDSEIRILRASKNRFGPTNEICLFKMKEEGLTPMNNLNEEMLNLSEESVSGTAFTAISNGNKVFVVEVQSLVTPTVFGYPQRKTVGVDNNRLQILSAVISKFTKVNTQNADIHLNLSGGQKSKDPSSDLAIVAAILSSSKNKALPKETIFIGEVGLGGEIKPVKNLESKLKEAEKIGFKYAVIPYSQKSFFKNNLIKLQKIKKINELIDFL